MYLGCERKSKMEKLFENGNLEKPDGNTRVILIQQGR
jgi:hypothetical protein